MAKLQIPELPTFETKIPSSGKSITFRPITVREESFLLLARESEEKPNIVSVVKELISNCVKLGNTKLKLIDVEWLFLQIRSKSVSNEIENAYRCSKKTEDGKICGARFESIIDINDIVVSGEPFVDVPINFNSGEYVIRVTSPSIDSISDDDEIATIFSMIEYIVNPNGEISTKDDISLEEFSNFILTFTDSQVKELKKATEKLQKLSYTEHLQCPVCKTKTENHYNSLFDFFS